MFYGCPGQDKRNIKAELVKCRCCGYEVEIFSDEARRMCPSCGIYILKTALPSCLLWCESAAKCAGNNKPEDFNKGG